MGEYKLVPVEPTREMREAGRGGWATNDPEEAARATYQAMLAATPSPEWVKVSERLPTIDDSDEGGNIWVWDGTDVHSIGWFNAVAKEVTHWMPKPRQQPPAPPTEKEGG